MLRVRQPGESMTELTRSIWVLMSPGKEAEINILMNTKTSLKSLQIRYFECKRYCTRQYCCTSRFQVSTEEKEGWERQFSFTAKLQIEQLGKIKEFVVRLTKKSRTI